MPVTKSTELSDSLQQLITKVEELSKKMDFTLNKNETDFKAVRQT